MVGVGAQLGGYELVALLGKGGFASLYLGRRTGPGGFQRMAAIKVMHAHLTEPRYRVMFTDEARVSARLAHPNIVRVEDFGEEDGVLYMVLEHVYGCSLAELLVELAERRRRLAIPIVVWLLMEVAEALHAAHEARDAEGKPLSLVHRDVSPQNILLSYSGYVKLIDFGIAKSRFRETRTKTGRVKGKLRYMAAEQAAGRTIDRRVDVYALGVVAWEMLCMRRAYEAASPFDLLSRIQGTGLPRVSDMRDVPAALDNLIALMLSPDRAVRPQNVRILRRELARTCPEAVELDAQDLAELIANVKPKLSKIAPEIDSELSLTLSLPDTPAGSHTDALESPSVPWAADVEADVPLTDPMRALTPPEFALAAEEVTVTPSEVSQTAPEIALPLADGDTRRESREAVMALIAAQDAARRRRRRQRPVQVVMFALVLVLLAFGVGGAAFLLVTAVL